MYMGFLDPKVKGVYCSKCQLIFEAKKEYKGSDDRHWWCPFHQDYIDEPVADYEKDEISTPNQNPEPVANTINAKPTRNRFGEQYVRQPVSPRCKICKQLLTFSGINKKRAISQYVCNNCNAKWFYDCEGKQISGMYPSAAQKNRDDVLSRRKKASDDLRKFNNKQFEKMKRNVSDAVIPKNNLSDPAVSRFNSNYYEDNESEQSDNERAAEAQAHAGGLVKKKSTWTHKKNGKDEATQRTQEDFEKAIQEHNEELMEESDGEVSKERIVEAQAHAGYFKQPTEDEGRTTTVGQRFKKNGGMLLFQLVGLGIIWFIGRTFLEQIGFDATLFFGALLVILFIIEIVHILFPEGGRDISSMRGSAGKIGSGAGKLWGKGREKLGPIKEKGKSGWNRVKEGASRREPEGDWKKPIKSEEWKDHWKETG